MSETSDESRPVECYRFEISGYDPMLFTSDEQDVVAEGETYVALPGLKRSSIGIATALIESDLSVTVPATSLLATRCGLFATPQRVALRFKRYQRADLDTPVMQFGADLDGASIQDESCTLTFSDVFSVGLAAKVPKNRIQPTCNWSLGDSNCGVNLALFAANVDQIAEVYNFDTPVAGQYTIQASWAEGVTPYDPLTWVGGVITGTYDDVVESRTIYEAHFFGLNRFQLRARLVLSRPFDSPLIGATFTITPGCDNSFARCVVLQNTPRFGGFQFVRTEQNSPFNARLDEQRNT
jgi:hypothetical protein